MNKHTPAPWTAHDDDGTGTLPCVLSDKVNKGGNFYVAQCNVYEDARLIAAAPELLDALKMCEIALRYINFDGELEGTFGVPAAQEAARAAIAKAEGTKEWTAEDILRREG